MQSLLKSISMFSINIGEGEKLKTLFTDFQKVLLSVTGKKFASILNVKLLFLNLKKTVLKKHTKKHSFIFKH